MDVFVKEPVAERSHPFWGNTSVGARVVWSGRVGLYGRPRPPKGWRSLAEHSWSRRDGSGIEKGGDAVLSQEPWARLSQCYPCIGESIEALEANQRVGELDTPPNSLYSMHIQNNWIDCLQNRLCSDRSQ